MATNPHHDTLFLAACTVHAAEIRPPKDVLIDQEKDKVVARIKRTYLLLERANAEILARQGMF